MSAGGSRRGRIRNTVRYYRTVAPHIERERVSRPDADFWTSVAEAHAGAEVLEIGCGTGRITRLFAPPADRVAAVDLSPDMLRRARREAPLGPDVHLVRADALDLPLPARFDLAIAANGVFSHLLRDDERLRAARELRRALRPGGTAVVDAFWLSRERRSRCRRPGGDRRSRVVGDGADALRVTEHWLCDPESARCRVRYRYRRPDGSDQQAESVLRYWTEPEVRELFGRAGLRIDAAWGDYDRSGWRPASDRLVVVARRPA